MALFNNQFKQSGLEVPCLLQLGMSLQISKEKREGGEKQSEKMTS